MHAWADGLRKGDAARFIEKSCVPFSLPGWPFVTHDSGSWTCELRIREGRSAATGLAPVERTFLHYIAGDYAHLFLGAPTPPVSVRREKLEVRSGGSAETCFHRRNKRGRTYC